MNFTSSLNDIRTRRNHQVIRIGKAQLQARFVGRAKIDTFQGCVGSNGHKARSFNSPMWSMDTTDSSLALARLVNQFVAKEITRRPFWEF